jgi:hypothetical protein
MRTLIGVLADAAREVHQAAVQRRRNVRPRVHRGGIYPLLRAFTTVLTRDVIVATVIGDMYAGRSVIYADFVGYDEVAHHSGVERYDALDTLRRLDHEFARLHKAAQDCPRNYEFVLLSDHGQSQGATFRTRYGETLAEFVARVLDAPAKTPTAPEDRKAAGEESWGYAGGALTEVAAGQGMAARVAGRLHRDRPEDPAPAASLSSDAPAGKDEAVVLASGNCALIYLMRETERLTSERITDLYPDLLVSLTEHPGIGFVLVRSQHRGPVVIGADGEVELATGRVTGTDPLAQFGPHARAQVARTDTFTHCADIMVNSLWDSQTDEVAAFEELVGSHGGLGGDQTRPFLLYPSSWPAPADELLGPEALHQQLRRWLAHVGQSAYDDAAAEGDLHIDVRRLSTSN